MVCNDADADADAEAAVDGGSGAKEFVLIKADHCPNQNDNQLAVKIMFEKIQ